MNVERELKLEPPAGFAVDVMPPLDDVTPSPPVLHRLHTVYYDTEDLRLLRWGCNLRYRAGSGWTLKLPALSSGMGLSRRELNFHGEPSAPPPAVLDLVTAYVRGRPLGKVAELRTVRMAVTFSSDGRPIAELDDDDVHVVNGEGGGDRFRQVEIELLNDAPNDVMKMLARHLRKLGVRRADPTPKILRALRLGEPPDPEIVVTSATSRSTAGETLRATLAASAESVFRLDPLIRLEAPAEAVHEARTSVRRMRSDLQTFRPLLDGAWADRTIEALRWLGNELGAARDDDVLLNRIRDRARTLSAEAAARAQPIVEAYAGEQSESRRRLAQTMRAARYVSVLEDVIEAANHPHFSEGRDMPAPDCVPRLMRRAWKKLRDEVERSDGTPTDRQLHRIRIRAKRARYSAEAFVPVVGEPAARFAERAKRLQELLGEHHDAVVGRHRLAAYQDHQSLAFVAGQLFALEGEIARDARTRWRRCWERTASDRVRFWR